jgi:nucleotide-binding universal stress UspA family protein
MTNIIISYDDTDNDRDALALGRLLGAAGANISLAYVRHAASSGQDVRDQREAEELLERGARSIGVPDAPRHVVINPSTGVGLAELAEREHADVVVFGSDYRTAPGAVSRGNSAQRLLHGGPAAVAIAPADLRSRSSFEIKRIGVLAEGDQAAEETARNLADALGASVVEPGNGPVDLLVVGSRSEGEAGRVTLSATAEYAIETASSPVLVVPRGVTVRFGTPALAGV